MGHKQLPQYFNLPQFLDQRGGLGVVEQDSIPFEIKRLYYIYDVPVGEIRGEHGHKTLQQFMICLNGQCRILLNDGFSCIEFKLDTPGIGLYLPPGFWRQVVFDCPNSILCVLASQPFDKDDYIYQLDKFIEWAHEKKAEQP